MHTIALNQVRVGDLMDTLLKKGVSLEDRISFTANIENDIPSEDDFKPEFKAQKMTKILNEVYSNTSNMEDTTIDKRTLKYFVKSVLKEEVY